jgi:hypothetical protein
MIATTKTTKKAVVPKSMLTKRVTRIIINACLTGCITSGTVLMTMQTVGGDVTLQFIVAAFASGAVAIARELQEHLGDGVSPIANMMIV